MATIKRCVKIELDASLIFKIHYIDLQILIFSLEIDSLKQYLRELQKQSDSKNGIENRIEATAEDYEKL